MYERKSLKKLNLNGINHEDLNEWLEFLFEFCAKPKKSIT